MMTRAALTVVISSVLAVLAPAAIAADIAVTPVPWATPAPAPLAPAGFYGDLYPWDYRPACQFHYYFACWVDPYGRPQCGCLPGLGYYLNRY